MLNLVVVLVLVPSAAVAKTVNVCAPKGKPVRILVNGSLPGVCVVGICKYNAD